MHMSKRVRRGFAVAAAASGLLALGVGSASADELPASATKTTTKTKTNTTTKTTNREKQAENRGVGVRHSEGKAVEHVTQEAGKAVSEAPSAPSNKDLGSLSSVPAEAAPSSAPGLPEGLVIEVPEVIPGVPSIGIIPSSIPALPVTPTVPAL
jgi:hypothetical protein